MPIDDEWMKGDLQFLVAGQTIFIDQGIKVYRYLFVDLFLKKKFLSIFLTGPWL